MDLADATALIAKAIPGSGGVWADFGAGDGTFTAALAELLGPGSRIYGVDREPKSIAALKRLAKRATPQVIPVKADFTDTMELPGAEGEALDGMLFGNSLHYVRNPDVLLARLVARLLPGGRVVLVEYDRRVPNIWVPYPIPARRLPWLAGAAGLTAPVVVARRPSAFGGDLYAATASRR